MRPQSYSAARSILRSTTMLNNSQVEALIEKWRKEAIHHRDAQTDLNREIKGSMLIRFQHTNAETY